ncbi:MAG: PspC domain-containing protein [Ardenticatenales bacterium]|nr:PspC domain-containing protein [Ardenticatenales bacterium]
MAHIQLRRQKGIIAGVCGGLGAFFGINPWVFRLLFLALIPAAGSPILPYLLLWLIIPSRHRY